MELKVLVVVEHMNLYVPWRNAILRGMQSNRSPNLTPTAVDRQQHLHAIHFLSDHKINVVGAKHGCTATLQQAENAAASNKGES